MLCCFIVEEPSQLPVVGVGFILPIIYQQAHLILQRVKIDRLFKQYGTAHEAYFDLAFAMLAPKCPVLRRNDS